MQPRDPRRPTFALHHQPCRDKITNDPHEQEAAQPKPDNRVGTGSYAVPTAIRFRVPDCAEAATEINLANGFLPPARRLMRSSISTNLTQSGLAVRPPVNHARSERDRCARKMGASVLRTHGACGTDIT